MKSLSLKNIFAMETLFATLKCGHESSVNKTPYSTKLRYRPSVLSSVATLMLLISWAADQHTAFADEATAPTEMEEVTVYGEKSLLRLKRAQTKAEDNAFDVFNALNTDHQYDIRCYKRKPLGSNISRRICYQNYMNVLEHDAAQMWIKRGKSLPAGGAIVSVPRQKRKEKNLRDIMDELKLEHPELVEALDAYSDAKHRYVTASKEK